MQDAQSHFIAIGGIGMSALAKILLEKGEKVSGSDIAASYVTEKMQKAGAIVYIGHSAQNIASPRRIIYSTDVPVGNIEYQVAQEKKIPCLHRSDLLAELLLEKKALLVGGTHGKTTTSSLLAHVLMHAGMDPSYAIGGMVRSLQSNGHHGKGEYFVAEACESDGTFLKYSNYGTILTNIDNDHLNFWKTEEALCKGYETFAKNASKSLFWCRDDAKLAALSLKGTSYGFSPSADLRIIHFEQQGWDSVFDLTYQGRVYKNIELPLIGKHNALNATAVFGLALSLGVAEHTARAAFACFQGVGRRAEKKGEVRSIAIYDDYAHHPTEILATLSAMREAALGKRLVVAFQPHRYSRTKECLEQFPEVFDAADELIVTDIYSAGEAPLPGVTIDVVLEKIKTRSKAKVHYVPRQELTSMLCSFLRPQDQLVTMGAGDITRVGPEVLKFFE